MLMRRTFIIALASTPVWALAFFLSHQFWKGNQAWGGDLPVPPLVSGVGFVALSSGILTLYFVIFDLISWYRKEHARKS
jgi:hypothetical protein